MEHRRTQRDVIKPAVAQLQAYDPHTRPGTVKLDANEYPYGLPPAVRESVGKAVAAVEINRYPDPEAERLRHAVGRWMGINPERVLLGNGSDEVIQMILMACGIPHGSVLTPTPTFSMYGIAAQVLDQRPVEVPLTQEWALDIPQIQAAIEREQPRVIFLATPNNPTANCFQDEGVRTLIEAAPGVIVIDEAYHPFSGQTFLPLLERYPQLIILRTLSKIGMAGLRVGILVTNPELRKQINKVRAPYNLNAYSQAAAEVILQHWALIAPHLTEIVGERERLKAQLIRMPGVVVFPSQANFLLASFAGQGMKVWEALGAQGILVRHYPESPMLGDCLRITVGTPAENEALIAALREILRTMQPLIQT
ncbi:MAG: histidinol-phosphate transaminase [Nitrospinae bacterium]|nr:histidinol-phosphate transaminase [Nitrospinota bacterium]